MSSPRPEYLATTSWLVTDRLRACGPTRCRGRRCEGRELMVGERITCVHNVRRLAAQPDADDALAYLCESCVARLERAENADLAGDE